MTEMNAIPEEAATCCGGPAPEDSGACCVNDADAKAAGLTGCGCGVPQTTQTSAPTSSCCS